MLPNNSSGELICSIRQGLALPFLFQDKLQKADDFWLEAGFQRHLSLRRIFGNPSRYKGPNGTEFFFAGYNLT